MIKKGGGFQCRLKGRGENSGNPKMTVYIFLIFPSCLGHCFLVATIKSVNLESLCRAMNVLITFPHSETIKPVLLFWVLLNT